ncbi:MAG: DUF6090 family protein [Lutimonas sp.]
MINFFRKIRKKMADNNKPMMYMRYAIGEIVLVVIGILIALQINTWNESRKEKNKAKIYTNKLINDIVQDTLNINELIDTGHEKTANINAYFKFFSEGDQTIDAYIDSVTKVNWTFFRYQPLNYTFEDMKSSGNLALLTEAQRRSMMELLNVQQQLGIIIEKTVTGTIDYNYEGNKYLDLSDHNFYKILGTDLSKKEKEKGLLAKHHAFEQLLSLYYYMDSFGTEIKEKSKMTIELLEGE